MRLAPLNLSAKSSFTGAQTLVSNLQGFQNSNLHALCQPTMCSLLVLTGEQLNMVVLQLKVKKSLCWTCT